MNLIGCKVKHKAFGVGVVTEQTGSYITVEFAAKTSKFQFPTAFENFIVAEDSATQAAILALIEEMKAEAERKRIEEEERKREEERRRKEEEEKKREEEAKKHGHEPKPEVRPQRVDGQRWTFYVFQGGTFEKEYKGGYLWAPVENKDGMQIHHWTRLEDVRKGDIIFHGYNACIQAISVAKGSCTRCQQPNELVVENLWEMDGRRVDTEYVYLKNPIRTADFVSDILRFCNVKYAPFDKDGNGNMGYLYDLNRELAHIFMAAAVKANPYLASEQFVAEFMSEADND